MSRSVQGLYGLPKICVSLPVLVNRKGATKIINLSLTETEEKQLQNSCKVLYEIIETLDL
ncbi:hypothetical protein [Planktothrix serta]|uniref:hypothetical protein n=1 Tax=Planktothrix serta TaxID=1678310 RepID=UPI001E4A9109|nr:hypothetical protein [Planktothrix serta]